MGDLGLCANFRLLLPLAGCSRFLFLHVCVRCSGMIRLGLNAHAGRVLCTL